MRCGVGSLIYGHPQARELTAAVAHRRPDERRTTAARFDPHSGALPAPSSSELDTKGFFSTLARSVLRHIRVESKQELKDRIMAAMDQFNRHPVVHTWSYKLDQAA